MSIIAFNEWACRRGCRIVQWGQRYRALKSCLDYYYVNVVNETIVCPHCQYWRILTQYVGTKHLDS